MTEAATHWGGLRRRRHPCRRPRHAFASADHRYSKADAADCKLPVLAALAGTY